MSCNCPTPNQCPNTALSCLCGLALNIFNSDGILVETIDASIVQINDDIYEVYGSTAFESVIGSNYVLSIYYNYELERWEMSYFNRDLGLSIVLGVLYGLQPTDCPLNNCWDLDCIAVGFNVLGVFNHYFSWEGSYINGRKSYTFTSDWSGPDINYRVSWTPDASTVPGSNAPAGTPGWILESEVSPNVWQSDAFLFNSNPCPYGQYITEFGGSDTRFSFTDLGVTGFDLKTVAIDCGCCDESIIIGISFYEFQIDDIQANVVKDEYGNVLTINGKQYYSFDVPLFPSDIIYYVYYDGEGWILSDSLDGEGTEYARLESNGDCPFGFYSINQEPQSCECISVTYQLVGEEPVTVQIESLGIDNGKNYYLLEITEVGTFSIAWGDIGDGFMWLVNKNDGCTNDFLRITYEEDGIKYTNDLSFYGYSNGQPAYQKINDSLAWEISYSPSSNWIFSTNEPGYFVGATSVDFITWTSTSGVTVISTEIISLANECIVVAIDGIDYVIQKTGVQEGKNFYNSADLNGGISFSVDRWILSIDGSIYEFVSDSDIPLSNNWIYQFGQEFQSLETKECQCINTQAILPEDTECPFGTYMIEKGVDFESFEISQCASLQGASINVKGSECFDCCDYYTPRNRNLLKKKKAIFVEEIASIRNREIFGLKCGPEWSDLFKKHLIFDVLWCLPYGVLCDDEEQCLINNLNENCNC